MPAIDDEDRPKKKIVHEIGQELALLSVKEIDERVALLKEEIARLEAAKAGKQASRNVADHSSKSELRQELTAARPNGKFAPAGSPAKFSKLLTCC